MSALEVDVQLQRGAFRLTAQFTAPADGITVLFGPSGSGKSSLLLAMAGLIPREGMIHLGARILDDCNSHVPPHQRQLGMVFQDARLFPHLTARGNIAYAWDRAPSGKRPPIEDLARFFDITSVLDRSVHNLSGGEKSRVALARALAAAPDFLLLDEPFAALDGQRRRAFIDVLLRMGRDFQLPMLVVTHDIDDAAALASNLVALKSGGVVAKGAFQQASGDPAFAALLDARDSGTAVPSLLLHSSRESERRHLWLRADHVVLAAERPTAISTRNILEGNIQSIRREVGEACMVKLQTSVGLVLARVTAEAVEELRLAPGRTAWALVKAHAL
jgi:molybdate transport system ATP-binding protein